ncbi:uncharacterized protein LOC141590202 [Silene latifolia]|uniref:uncharacterized protein LOC141590202 n=1 Tax=Silene latifolia TaxID=37657 RepID=UPI003D76CC19
MKLDDTLWDYRTAYMTLIGTSLYSLVYGNASHLPVEMEHKAYWAVKELNMDVKLSGEKWLLQLNELDEFHLQAYERSCLYKEKTKRWIDKKILKKEFQIGDKVLLFNSRFKLFSGKFRSRRSGPFTVTNVNKFGSVEVMTTNGEKFKANGHQMAPKKAPTQGPTKRGRGEAEASYVAEDVEMQETPTWHDPTYP